MKKFTLALFLSLLLCSCSSIFEPGHAQVELNVDSIARELAGTLEFSTYIIECHLLFESEENDESFYQIESISEDDIKSKKARSFKFTDVPLGIGVRAVVRVSGQLQNGNLTTLYIGESDIVMVNSSKIELNVKLEAYSVTTETTINTIQDITIECEDLEQITSEEPAETLSYPESTVSKNDCTLEFNVAFTTGSSVSDSAVYEWILNDNIIVDEKSGSFTLDCLTNEYVNYSEEGELNTLVVVVTDGTQSKSAQIQFVLKYVEE